jgi:hypothetical protein
MIEMNVAAKHRHDDVGRHVKHGNQTFVIQPCGIAQPAAAN